LRKGFTYCAGIRPNVVPEWLNLARDAMRARAGLQADKAGRRQIDKPADKLVARYLDAYGDGAALVEADEVESVLDVEADRRDRIRGFLMGMQRELLEL
jgi:hypothetical protein